MNKLRHTTPANSACREKFQNLKKSKIKTRKQKKVTGQKRYAP
jgi:hypothetical protein